MDLLITILALLVAVYAVVPRARQLDLRLRITSFDRFSMLLGFFFVLYLEFNEFFSARGWVIHKPWPVGITPRHAVYLVMFVVAAFLWFRIRFARLTPGKIQEFRELVEQLYWSESYGELLTLLQGHLTELFRIEDSRFFLMNFRARLQALSSHQYYPRMFQQLQSALGQSSDTAVPRKKNVISHLIRKWGQPVMRPIAPALVWMLPDQQSSQATAHDIIRIVFLSSKFVAALVKTRPYFGLQVIREAAHCREKFEFADIYLTELMRDTQSALYAEVRNNQNCGVHRYHLSESNRLLQFFLSDVKVAKQFGVYKAIGDYVLAHLHDVGRDHQTDPYNLAMTDFKEVGAWRSPLFVAIRFFDIMLKEALFQGIEWHMWLYYMPRFVERITQNYRIVDPTADPTDEWPIRYSFLLYEIFAAMRDWVMAMEDVPRNQHNVSLRSTNTEHENGNIPKSTILALGECSRDVLECDRIEDQLKRYLMNIVFTMYFDLRAVTEFEGYAAVLLRAISDGGFFRRSSDSKYREALVRAFEPERIEYLIKRPQEHVEELEAGLR